MKTLDFVMNSDYSSDIILTATFSELLPPSLMQDMFRELLRVFKLGMELPILFEGPVDVHVTETGIAIRLRFSQNEADVEKLDPIIKESVPETRVHFTIHILASINRIQKVEPTPLFQAFDLQNFIEFPE